MGGLFQYGLNVRSSLGVIGIWDMRKKVRLMEYLKKKIKDIEQQI